MAHKTDVVNESSALILRRSKEKLLRLKEPQYFALGILEFILTLILITGIVLFLDGRYNTIQPPFNIFIFGAIIFAVLHTYNYTQQYRLEKATKRKTSLRIFLLELAIFLVILVSTYIYQDPSINTLPRPFNFILFLAILVVPVYFYVNEKFVK